MVRLLILETSVNCITPYEKAKSGKESNKEI